jgi:hypothetical protein
MHSPLTSSNSSSYEPREFASIEQDYKQTRTEQRLRTILPILTAVGLVLVAVGIAGLGAHQGWWSAGALNHLGKVKSITLITTGGVMLSGSLFGIHLVRPKSNTDNAKINISDVKSIEIQKPPQGDFRYQCSITLKNAPKKITLFSRIQIRYLSGLVPAELFKYTEGVEPTTFPPVPYNSVTGDDNRIEFVNQILNSKAS